MKTFLLLFLKACLQRNLDEVNRLIEAGVDVNEKTPDGFTALTAGAIIVIIYTFSFD
jgi:ankyrin repeat protein